MEARAWLELQVEWGADEALLDAPRDRMRAAAPALPKPEDVGLAGSAWTPAAGPAGSGLAGCGLAGSGLGGGGLAGGVRMGQLDQARQIAGQAGDLEALRGALAMFDACALQATAYRLVFGSGAEQAPVMVIGDAPGDAEDRSGAPFQGAGGVLLRQMLASIGLSDVNCRLAYALPWRPPGNRMPSEHERQQCLPFLHRHIALVRPRLLLLLGQAVAGSLLGIDGAALRRLRGQWQDVAVPGLADPVACLASASPEHLLKTPADRRQAWAGLLELRIRLETDRSAEAGFITET